MDIQGFKKEEHLTDGVRGYQRIHYGFGRMEITSDLEQSSFRGKMGMEA